MKKVLLLGRPNVGKSTLFNRLIRSNRAITHDRPGITRDRMEGRVRARSGRMFGLVDTGGIHLDGHEKVAAGPRGIEGFEEQILRQAEEAMTEASVLALVVDGREGLTPFDEHLAARVRREGKPALVVVNKVDGLEKEEQMLAEFYALGFPLLAVSAAHGHNVRALEEELDELLGPDDDECPPDADSDDMDDQYLMPEGPDAANEDKAEDGGTEDGSTKDASVTAPGQASDKASSRKRPDIDPETVTLRLCLLGRPNAGKSSLVNAFLGRERMIVSDVAGTTRDSIDVPFTSSGQEYVFVDTAGVRRRSKIDDEVERYSVNSAIKSTTKAHVTLLVLDAAAGLSQQDKRLIDLLNERKTPFMVLLNKMDLVPAREREKMARDLGEALQFCGHVPLIRVSALKRQGLAKVLPLARQILRECLKRVPTSRLNRAMEEALQTHQPPVVRRVRPKFYYLTQAESMPPTFVFFVNDAERVAESYVRYLEKSLRRIFSIKHAPMRVHLRSSHKKSS